jgi:hypothetical protein
MRFALMFVGVLAMADTPADVVELFRTAAAALANKDAAEFLGQFDKGMPGYSQLRDEIEELMARGEVGSAIEIVTDGGDEQKRTLELDWVLEIADQQARRKVLKCAIERRGKKWKIVSFDPVDFFKY